MHRYLTLGLVFGLHLMALGQSRSQIRKADQLFKNRGEIHFWFLLKNQTDKKALTRVISIDHVQGDTVWAFANKRGLLRFFELGYSRFHLLRTPAEEYRKSLPKSKAKGQTGTAAFDAYPTYSQYEQIMQQFETDHPAICKLVNLGTLPSGRKILALKITDSLNKRENEPQFLYTSTMHGDETAGYPLMLKLADDLLNGYGTNPRLTNLVREMEIWINPLANPDGTYRGGNNTVAGASRFNAANVDLNRNFPDPEDGPHPDGEAYQPETKIFMALADSMEFVMAANFHGGAEVANFPWDTWQRRPADELWWTTESVRFVDSARSQAPASFFSTIYGYPNLPGVTQGFEWYEVNGGRQDFMNWFHHCRELTVELSDTKLLPENQIANHWTYLRESLLGFMEASLKGIRGKVTDLCTGKPIQARVRILNHDLDNSFVFSSSKTGNYFRPISPGSKQVEFSAPGYQTLVLPAVVVNQNGPATVRNLALQPIAPSAAFSVVKTGLCSSTVQFQDASGSASEWFWDFGDGDTSVLQNPTHTYSGQGNYTVSLTVKNCAGRDTLVSANGIRIVSPVITSVSGDTSFCGAVRHTLKAVSPNQVAWYASANSSVVLDTGQVFTTDTLNATTLFYTQAFTALSFPKGGPASNTIGQGGFFTANTYHYLIFDAENAFQLRSVKVFANTAGNRTIQLRSATGAVLLSRNVFIPQGESRVVLDWNIPAGSSLQLGCAGGNSNNLYRNSSGAVYPYTVAGLYSITGNSAGEPNYYYYFYDWETSARCETPRQPVTALVTNAPNQSITILVSPSTVCEHDTVLLTAAASNSENSVFTWASGTSSLGTGNPVQRSGLAPGAYLVRASVLSSNPCTVFNPALSNTRALTVLPAPSAPVVDWSNGNLVSASGPVLWYVNNELISSSPATNLTPQLPGTYSAVQTGSNGCRSLPSPGFVVTGTKNQLAPDLKLWFSEGVLFVHNPGGKSRLLQVFSQEGKKVMEKSIGTGQFSIPCQQLPAGRYLIASPEEPTAFSFLVR